LNQDFQIPALVERLGVGSQLTRGVLVVDDEPLNLRVLKDLLEDQWTVHQAASGAEALEIAGRVPLDVVVTDQRMPGMKGVDLLAELRVRRPDLAGIVLTGFADMQALESAINRAGAFRFLRKPWEPADVLSAIEQAAAFVARGRTIEKLVERLAVQGEELRTSLDELRAQQAMLIHMERVGTIGRLSAGVAHDLRNVITGLSAAEQEMRLSHADALLRSLQTLRDYTRTGSMALSRAPVELGTVVETAVAISRMDPHFRQRAVELQVAPGLPSLRGDGQKLTQVLVNLVRNALQASPARSTVRIQVDSRGGNQVVSVEDEGPGISPDLRDRLFQPFVSGKGDQGLGMGLYMARLIIESHGGRIAASTGQRGGARFEVVLPAGGPVEQSLGAREGISDGAEGAV
jgi:signal transduction histidine kinase